MSLSLCFVCICLSHDLTVSLLSFLLPLLLSFSYGDVFFGSWASLPCAIKVIKENMDKREGAVIIKHFREEIALHRSVSQPQLEKFYCFLSVPSLMHSVLFDECLALFCFPSRSLPSIHIVAVYAVCLDPASPALVMEYCPNRSLHDYLLKHREQTLNRAHAAVAASPSLDLATFFQNPLVHSFPWTRRLSFALMLAQAMRHLYSRSPIVFHRDLKGANVLVCLESKVCFRFRSCCIAIHHDAAALVAAVRLCLSLLFDRSQKMSKSNLEISELLSSLWKIQRSVSSVVFFLHSYHLDASLSVSFRCYWSFVIALRFASSL